ncbi:MAG: Site-specific recombinase XerD [Streptosporangiaceae bacterium]|nr:Site-specific recombinase XerD [Streptosporangiaceae bacterium]
MAWVRRLPAPDDPKKPRLWAATVRLPPGSKPDRVTKTDELKGVVQHWADDLEADMRRGDWIDPRASKKTVGECWEQWAGSRRLERASRLRDESHWRCHVQPRWNKVPVGAILRPDVTGWIVAMEKAGVGAATIEGAVGVLRSVLDLAVDARLIRDNPARGVKPPKRDAHLDRVLDPSEDELLLAAYDRLFGDRPDGRLMCELLLYCGLRWEEAGGLDRDHVDTRRALLHIGPVLERDGTIRPYPKTPAGKRSVPVDRDLWPRLRAHVLTVAPGGLVVTSPGGGPLDYSRWYSRVWRVALEGKPAYAGAKGHQPRPAILGAMLDDPQPTPHDLRHTYGTRLGEQGMPGHEIMALMGHENLTSVQRYLHAGDGRHDRARDAVERGRASRS